MPDNLDLLGEALRGRDEGPAAVRDARRAVLGIVEGRIGPASFERFADGSSAVALPVVGVLCELGMAEEAFPILTSLNPAQHPGVVSLARDLVPDISPARLFEARRWVSQFLAALLNSNMAPQFPLFVRRLNDRGHFDLVDAIRSSLAARHLSAADGALIDAMRDLWRGDYEQAAGRIAGVPMTGPDALEAELIRTIEEGQRDPSAEVASILKRIGNTEQRSPLVRESAKRWRAEVDVRRGDELAARESLGAAPDHPTLRFINRLYFGSNPDGRGAGALRGFHEWVIHELTRLGVAIPPPENAEETEGEKLWRILRVFGGNRTDTVTVCENGRLRLLTLRTARQHLVHLQSQVRREGVEAILAEFRRMAAEWPELILCHTYRGELLLWLGRSQEAADDFEHACRTGTNRWSQVGLGAALAALGRFEDAERVWAEGGRIHHGRLPGEATSVYEAELRARRGRFGEAEEALGRVLKAKDSRAGGWLLRAEIAAERGDSEGQRKAFQRVVELCPGVFGDVLMRDPALPRRLREGLDNKAALELARSLRASMRTNVSSWLYTWFDGAGEFRMFAHVVEDRLARALRWISRVGSTAPSVRG